MLAAEKSERVLALYGIGEGPAVRIEGRRCVAHVVGTIKPGSRLTYYVFSKDGEVTAVEIDVAGEYELPEGFALKVRNSGKSAALLCFVRMYAL